MLWDRQREDRSKEDRILKVKKREWNKLRIENDSKKRKWLKIRRENDVS